MYQIEHFELAKCHSVSLKLGAGCEVRVTLGRLWLTRPEHLEDVWLHNGETWTLPTASTVWLSGEPSARFQLAHTLTTWRWPALVNLRRRMSSVASERAQLRALAHVAGSQWQAG